MHFKYYAVGGCVRDMFLGITPKDYDYVVVGETPEKMLSLGFKQVGAQFPVFLHPETNHEYALARTERKSGNGYHGFICDFSDDMIPTELIKAFEELGYDLNGDYDVTELIQTLQRITQSGVASVF